MYDLCKIHFLTIISILFLIPLFPGKAFANAENNRKFRVLVVHSYAPDYVAYPDLNRMIAEGFQRQDIQAEIRTFYLDCEQYRETEETQRMYDYIDSVCSWQPDLILVNEDQATYSLLSCGHPLVQATPVVFTGVNFPNWELLKKYTEITGIWDKPDYLETIRMVEQILGKTRIRFLYDDTYLGRQVTREIADQLKKDHPRTSLFLYNYLKDPTVKVENTLIDILQENQEPNIDRPDSTSFYFVNLRNKGGSSLLWLISGMVKHAAFIQTKYDYTAIRIGRMAVIPTFTVIDEGFDYNQGILGGYITTTDIQAAEATALAARILKGEKISNIPISQSRKKHVVDWNELIRWDIPQESLPEDYEIINIPFHVHYKVEIAIVGVLFSFSIVALIFYLSYLYTREARRKRKAQSNLKREKEFLSLALEGGNVFVWKYDKKRDLIIFDKEFFESLGITPRMFDHRQMQEILHPDDISKVIQEFRQISSSKHTRSTLHCRCDFNGSGYLWYEFRYINISATEPVIGLILNIEDYKKREEELTEARDLAAKAELKQSFLANMSHEIRTPLNAIVGFSNLLTVNEEQTQEERQKFIDIINQNCELLLKLIGDILEISRIESNSLNFTFQEINLNELISDIYATHQMLMPPNVELRKDIPVNSAVISTDKLRLNQVITNLINNAVKFTSSGYISLGYTVNPVKRQVSIYVRDTGKGIPAKEQKMIFERFYKRDEFVQGTGLGLSICLGIVEKLGGEISLESEEGEGSIFTIHLPYTPHQTAGDEQISQNAKEITNGHKHSGKRRKTILIAEDNESNYLLLKTILQKHYDLIWVKNGREAVESVDTHHVDLILMDVKMPEMNGLEALKNIRKKYRDIPVVMQTAYAFESDREEAELAGCNGFITKPVVAAQLLETVRNIIWE